MPGNAEVRALVLCRNRIDVEELIDRPETSIGDIRDSLRDQELVNRWLGGGNATWAHAFPLLRECESDPIRVLELACGGADLSRGIVDEARRLGRRTEVIGLDLNEKTIACARERIENYSEISLVQGDALGAPFEPGQFDIVIAATFLHHLSPEKVIEALREAGRLSKGWVVAADLVRSSPASIGIRLFGWLTGFNRISIHDGVISVCRAYSPSELAELAGKAGLGDWRIYRHRLYRMTLVYRGFGHLPGRETEA